MTEAQRERLAEALRKQAAERDKEAAAALESLRATIRERKVSRP